MKTMKIAMIGVGAISGIYLQNITKTFKEIELIGVCDLIRERAEKAQADYNVPKIYNDMTEAFADPEVDIILNLTRPYQHYDVTRGALLAGKNVYSEKPLGASIDEGIELVRIAKEKGLLIAGAPDTFMGAGIQTCRKLIDDGYIGDIVGASAFMTCHGHESWHPDPDFYYQYGGGPMMDMGPYYITAMVNLMGGVEGVVGMVKKSFAHRLITSQPHYGEDIEVNVPTYVAGTMRFESGAVGTIFTTFDVWQSNTPRIEIYGTRGTLTVPDPNTFGGPVQLFRPEDGHMRELPICFPYADNSRALGLCDMAKSLADGRPCRCDYNQTFHVLEIMQSFTISNDTGKYIPMTSKYHRGAPMNPDCGRGILD
ncbi:MAG: Gfo/Idh/MocA family oxidoreductase [Eubacteriales bacterium]